MTDQRGFPRPAGSAADIGAFEYASMLPTLSIARASASLIDILVQGNSNQWCRVLASTNLSDWFPINTNRIGLNGTFVFQQSNSPNSSCRFYRAVIP